MNPKVFSINGIGHNSHRQWTFHYSSCYRSTSCRCIPVCTQVHDQCHVRRLVVIIVLSWCFQCVQKYRKIASNLFTYMGTHIPCTVHVHTSFFTYIYFYFYKLPGTRPQPSRLRQFQHQHGVSAPFYPTYYSSVFIKMHSATNRTKQMSNAIRSNMRVFLLLRAHRKVTSAIEHDTPTTNKLCNRP